MTVNGRTFDSDVPGGVLGQVQAGTMRTRYRGVPFFKSPFDIGLYLQLLSRLAPRTVIEVGTRFGGSALWFADMLCAQGVPSPRVIGVDIDPQAGFVDPRITFLRGDASRLGDVLTRDLLAGLVHPLLVVEDSSHFYEHSKAVLEFFDPWLHAGDYVVVEDGIVSQMPGEIYQRYENGPNRAVAEFLARRGDDYEIDASLCDHYGRNVTYNPNGWLRRR